MILVAAQLTPSGRPVLQPGEVEISLLDKVDLEFEPVGGLAGQQAHAYKHGYAILTNRRLIWVDAGPTGDAGHAPTAPTAASSGGGGGGAATRAASVPLSAVVACNKKVQYRLKGAKVRLLLEVYTDRQRQPVPASGFHTNIDLLWLRCRGPAPDTFKLHLEEQVRHAVTSDATAAGGAAGAGAQTPRTGVGGGAAVQPLDAHLSPLRAGLQARPGGPPPAVGPAGAALAASPASPAATAATAGPQSPAAPLRPDPALLQSMVEMGFPRNRAARSLIATGNRGAQEAIDYLLAFGDQPGMDDPLDQPPGGSAAAAAAGGEVQTLGAAGGWQGPFSPTSPHTSALYPAILPAEASAASSATSAQSPYAYLYGSLQAPASPGTQAQPSPSSSPLSAALQQQVSLRAHSHQYGSAPELAGSAAATHGSVARLESDGAPPRAIGVAGIVQREHQKTAESGRAMEQAFRDLSALMSSAATMVSLAEKFRGVLAADGSGGSGPGGEDPLLMDLDTQQQLIALGISSPVTRETAGARYHIELSRQLADFLATPLQRCKGLMSLPDVYCLFNRARGTELVSPDDLMQAAKLFARAGVQGLRLRTLRSGVLVIQGPQHSEEQVCAKIAQLTAPPPPAAAAVEQEPVAGGSSGSPSAPGAQVAPALGPGLTSSELALALGGISVAIAAEHLLTAEARGVVCRDDGPEGLRFYRNFFLQDRMAGAAVLGG